MRIIVSFKEVNTEAKHIFARLSLGLMTAVTASIVALMPVHAFVSTWLGTLVGPLLVWKSWKEILLAAIVPVVIGYCLLRPDIARTIWGRTVNRLIALYVVLHLLWSLSADASAQAIVAGLLMNIRFFAIFVLVQVITEARPHYLERLKAIAPRWLLYVSVGLGILAIAQVTLLPIDFLVQFGYGQDTIAPYVLVDQNVNAVRAFATMRGPNTLGAYLLLPVAVALYAVYLRRRDILALAALLLGFIGVYLTGSRSAWLGLLVALTVLVLLVAPKRDVVRWTKRLIVPVIVLVAVVGWAAMNVPSVRLAVFHSSPDDAHLLEGSTQKHWEATARGIQDVVRHPWGSGPGSAGPASFYDDSGVSLSENYYVQIAQEVGLIGLGLFIAICIATIRVIVRRSGILPAALVASFAGISLINIFLHGWADDPTSLTWWALAGLYMGSDEER